MVVVAVEAAAAVVVAVKVAAGKMALAGHNLHAGEAVVWVAEYGVERGEDLARGGDGGEDEGAELGHRVVDEVLADDRRRRVDDDRQHACAVIRCRRSRRQCMRSAASHASPAPEAGRVGRPLQASELLRRRSPECMGAARAHRRPCRRPTRRCGSGKAHGDFHTGGGAVRILETEGDALGDVPGEDAEHQRDQTA